MLQYQMLKTQSESALLHNNTLCPRYYNQTLNQTMPTTIMLSVKLFPLQVVAFFLLCLAALVFYIRNDCNKNRRLRIFMSTIAAADMVCIQMLVIMYIYLLNGSRVCRLGPNEKCLDKPMSCYITFYYNFKTFITFFANLAAASSTWSITMMLFDHLAGIKNPFIKQTQDRPVKTAYLTILIVIVVSFGLTVYNVFAFIVRAFGMAPMQNADLLRVFSLVSIIYQYVVPTIFMFIYIFLISYHIHESQKVFSNRNEVCHAATRSSSTDGLRVHRGRRTNDSQRKVKIVPRMLVFIATNCLLTNMPSAYLILSGYVINAGAMYENNSKQVYVETFFLSNFCLITGKIMFYLIVLLSHSQRFLNFISYFIGCQSKSKHLTDGSVQSDNRRKLSKTLIAHSNTLAAVEDHHSLVMRRSQSSVVCKTMRKLLIEDKSEVPCSHKSNLFHPFNVKQASAKYEENKNKLISSSDDLV